MNIAEIVGLTHQKVYNLFKYTSDKKNYDKPEDWRSHAKEVNEGKEFKDDCDGFALTCAELILEQGVDRERVMIIICKTEENEQHLVCGISIDNDPDYGKTTYICDNRNKTVKAWNEMHNYTWQYFMKMSEPGQWYQVIR